MGLFNVGSILNPVAMVANMATVGADIWQTKVTNKANKKLQESANAANVALWREQAAYNTPAAQMTRLRAAGLSPQLAYGQIADAKMSSPPTMQAPRMSKPDTLQALSAYQQVMNLQEQNALIRAQQKQSAAVTAGVKLENEYRSYENKVLKDAGIVKGDTQFMRTFGRAVEFGRAKLKTFADWAEAAREERLKNIKLEYDLKTRR